MPQYSLGHVEHEPLDPLHAWADAGRVQDGALRAGPSRLLFGTDSSFFPRGWQRGIHEAQKAAVNEAGISESDQALIFGGNFEQLVSRRWQ